MAKRLLIVTMVMNLNLNSAIAGIEFLEVLAERFLGVAFHHDLRSGPCAAGALISRTAARHDDASLI